MKPIIVFGDTDMTDEQISAALAGESLKGPREFKGRKLATLTRTAHDLRNKVVAPDDTGSFFDVALIHILAEDFAEDPAKHLAARRALIAKTDDVNGFRAAISYFHDALTDEDTRAARALVDEILGYVEKAETEIMSMEKKSLAPEASLPTPEPSPSSNSPESSPDAPPTN